MESLTTKAEDGLWQNTKVFLGQQTSHFETQSAKEWNQKERKCEWKHLIYSYVTIIEFVLIPPAIISGAVCHIPHFLSSLTFPIFCFLKHVTRNVWMWVATIITAFITQLPFINFNCLSITQFFFKLFRITIFCQNYSAKKFWEKYLWYLLSCHCKL